MPYKYIGRTTNFKGKTLWEIVGNLKNFGVGRVVTRQIFDCYPEPTYFKILKVEPLPCPEKQTMDDMRKVRVLVERTFRGETAPKPVQIERVSYKADYRLIPKDKEAEYCRKIERKNEKVYPKYIEFPPLFKELIVRERRAAGENVDEEPKLEIVYNRSFLKKNRIASDNETPNVEVTMGLGKTENLSLYENIKL